MRGWIGVILVSGLVVAAVGLNPLPHSLQAAGLATSASTELAAAGWSSNGPFAPGADPPVPLHVNGIDASPAFSVDRTLFAATVQGIYRTRDGGQSWERVLEVPAAIGDGTFARVRVSPAFASDKTVFAAFYDPAMDVAQLYRSTDGGGNWEFVTEFGGSVTALVLSPAFATDLTLFVIVDYGEFLMKSTDGGYHWELHRFLPPEDYYNAHSLAASPDYAHDQTLFATGFGNVRRSTDGGVTWAPLNTYGPTFGVAVAPNYPADGSIWATYRFIESPGDGTPESSVIRSTDGGEHWSISGVGLPGYYSPFPRMLGVSPNYAVDRQVFAVLYGEPVGPPEHSLFRSYDGGESWVDLGPAPGNPDVLDVVVTYAPDDGVRVHLATTQGVWHYGGVCEQRLVNGGFETDAAWIFPATPFPADYSILQVHSGYRSLRAGVLDGADNVRSYSSGQQSIQLPADALTTTLSLWWYPVSSEDNAADAAARADLAAAEAAASAAFGDPNAVPTATGDRQYILLLDDTGAVLERLLWMRSDARAWQSLAFDLSKYAGRSVRIHLGVYNDGMGGVTAMFADDIALTVCGSTSPMANAYLYLPLVLSAPAFSPAPTPNLVAAVDLGLRARGVTVDAAGEQAFVAMTGNDGYGVLGVVRLDSFAVTHQIPLGPSSSSLNDVALAADGTIAFVAEREAGAVAAIDLVSGTVVARIPAGSLPNGLAIRSGLGYAASSGSNSVTVFDAVSYAVTRTLTNVGQEPALFVAESGLGTPPVGEDGLYLSAHDSDAVYYLRGGQSVSATQGVTKAYGLAYDATAQRLYVANRGPIYKVSVIDTTAQRILGAIDTGGKEPYVLTVNPSTGHLFVVCDEEVRVYRTADWSLLTIIPAAAGAESRIAFDPISARVLVTDFDHRMLSVIQDQ